MASHYSQSFGANMMMSNKRFSWDIGYAGGKNKTEYCLGLESNHDFEEKNYDIALKTQQMFDHFSHKLFSNFDVDFRKDESLNISYTGQFTDPNTDYMSELRMDGQKSFSENLMHGGMQLHSLDLAYKYKKVNIGIDYLNYNEDSEQRLNGWMTESDMSELHRSQSEQRLNKYKLYINNSNRVWNGSLTYGAETFYSSTYNEHITETDNLYGDDKSYDLKQNELSISAYIGYGCKLGKKGMLNLSVKGEYFKSVVEQMGRNNTLWEDFNVYPNMTLVYRAIPRMTLQFSLASNKNYPAYWITNPNRSYMNPYSVTEGNPFLKPYESYQVNLNSIFKRKYIFGIFANMSPDYSTQVLYQQSDKLSMKYKYYNFDYSNKYGILAVVPIRWCEWANTKVTSNIFLMHQKGHFEDLSFDRRKITGRINLSNVFVLDKQKTLSFTLSGWYQLPVIQGIYNVKDMYDISAAIVWKPKKVNLEITLTADDVFDLYKMNTVANWRHQNYSFRNYTDSRRYTLTLKYLFRGYKSPKYKEPDKSRIGM